MRDLRPDELNQISGGTGQNNSKKQQNTNKRTTNRRTTNRRTTNKRGKA